MDEAIPEGKEEEGRKNVLIQAPNVEEHTPLKAKNGVRLKCAQHKENVAEERLLVLVYQETTLTLTGAAGKDDDDEMVLKEEF